MADDWRLSGGRPENELERLRVTLDRAASPWLRSAKGTMPTLHRPLLSDATLLPPPLAVRPPANAESRAPRDRARQLGAGDASHCDAVSEALLRVSGDGVRGAVEPPGRAPFPGADETVSTGSDDDSLPSGRE